MAFVAVTVKTDAAPTTIEVGLALMLTVAAEIGVTVTVEGAEAFPPAPVALAV